MIKRMKTKFIFALAAFLLMGSTCLKAQENNNSSITYQEGDLNHDGEVDVADITYLVNLIINKKKTDFNCTDMKILGHLSVIIYGIIERMDLYKKLKVNI